MSAALGDRRMRMAAAILAGVKLWFVSAQATVGVGAAAADDRLFLILAEYLLHGEWLGPYSQWTLAKGPAFSAFIAGTVWAGVPLPLAQHLLYLLGCWLLVRALRPLLRTDLAALFVFAALAWQPMSYEMPVLGRVLRQNFYTPCTLLVFAGFAALWTRRNAAARVRAGWALLAGAALGALWLTREESVWIVPSVLLLSAAVLFAAGRERTWRRTLWPLATIGAAAITPVMLVSALNQHHYGWFGTVEFRSKEFVAAYAALNRVRAGPSIPLVPLTRQNREAAYGISPTFALLRPELEGWLGEAWARISAPTIQIDPTHREIGGGWWMWALRDAVKNLGYAPDAASALAFYQRIADEVNAACDSGQVPALPPRNTMIPPWEPAYTKRLQEELPGYFWYFVSFSGFSARSPKSEGEADLLQLFRDLTQWHLAPSDNAPELRTPTAKNVRAWRVGALHDIGSVLRPAYIVLAAGGVLAWLWGVVAAIRQRKWPTYLWGFATAALGATLAVVLVNFMVHVTSFGNRSAGAFAQAYPLLVLFAVAAQNAMRSERRASLPTPN